MILHSSRYWCCPVSDSAPPYKTDMTTILQHLNLFFGCFSTGLPNISDCSRPIAFMSLARCIDPGWVCRVCCCSCCCCLQVSRDVQDIYQLPGLHHCCMHIQPSVTVAQPSANWWIVYGVSSEIFPKVNDMCKIKKGPKPFLHKTNLTWLIIYL